jgi:hypothetical protein
MPETTTPIIVPAAAGFLRLAAVDDGSENDPGLFEDHTIVAWRILIPKDTGRETLGEPICLAEVLDDNAMLAIRRPDGSVECYRDSGTYGSVEAWQAWCRKFLAHRRELAKGDAT